MSSVSGGATVIVDKDGGDAVTVTGSKLDVNATLVGDLDLDIGDVEILGHDAIGALEQNVTDSAVVLASNACKHADIMARLSNTGIVYIGRSGVSADTGIALYPGDVYSVDIANTNLLYCISTVSGDDINVVFYN